MTPSRSQGLMLVQCVSDRAHHHFLLYRSWSLRPITPQQESECDHGASRPWLRHWRSQGSHCRQSLFISNFYLVSSHRIASHPITSHRIASYRLCVEPPTMAGRRSGRAAAKRAAAALGEFLLSRLNSTFPVSVPISHPHPSSHDTHHSPKDYLIFLSSSFNLSSLLIKFTSRNTVIAFDIRKPYRNDPTPKDSLDLEQADAQFPFHREHAQGLRRD
jgi:hypothetical protein